MPPVRPVTLAVGPLTAEPEQVPVACFQYQLAGWLARVRVRLVAATALAARLRVSKLSAAISVAQPASLYALKV